MGPILIKLVIWCGLKRTKSMDPVYGQLSTQIIVPFYYLNLTNKWHKDYQMVMFLSFSHLTYPGFDRQKWIWSFSNTKSWFKKILNSNHADFFSNEWYSRKRMLIGIVYHFPPLFYHLSSAVPVVTLYPKSIAISPTAFLQLSKTITLKNKWGYNMKTFIKASIFMLLISVPALAVAGNYTHSKASKD